MKPRWPEGDQGVAAEDPPAGSVTPASSPLGVAAASRESGMQPLLVIGAGGLGREVVEAARSVNAQEPCWELVGFLDDAPDLQGQTVSGLPVLGAVSAIASYATSHVVLAVGSPKNLFARKRVADRLGLTADRYATIVHPGALLAASTVLGPGSIVLAGAVATTEVRVGSHVVIMPHVVLTHDDLIGDYVTLAAGARLAGVVTVGEGAYVGSGAVVKERRRVGSWSLVGMGAVVTKDVPAGEVWAGCPATFMRQADAVGVDVIGDTTRPQLGSCD